MENKWDMLHEDGDENGRLEELDKGTKELECIWRLKVVDGVSLPKENHVTWL